MSLCNWLASCTTYSHATPLVLDWRALLGSVRSDQLTTVLLLVPVQSMKRSTENCLRCSRYAFWKTCVALGSYPGRISLMFVTPVFVGPLGSRRVLRKFSPIYHWSCVSDALTVRSKVVVLVAAS